MSSNGKKYVTWTAFGIFVTIILFMFTGAFTMIGSFTDSINELKEITYRVDERTKILDSVSDNKDISQASIINPYKNVEKISLDDFINSLKGGQNGEDRNLSVEAPLHIRESK